MKPARIVFFEIPSAEPASCLSFYQKVFGWQFRQLEGQSYWLAKTGPDHLPGINGGIISRSAFNQSVVNTLQVQNLDHMMVTVKAHGGEVISEELLLPGIGRSIYFTDPEGHVFKGLQVNHPDK